MPLLDDSPPPPPRPDRRRWLWTAPQRRALASLILAAVALLALRQLGRPRVVPDRQAAHPPRYEDLADRLDPNTATAAELGVLPGLGPAKAAAIIDYRQSVAAPPAFRAPGDLARVRGIGPAMVAKLSPFLMFPELPAPRNTNRHESTRNREKKTTDKVGN